MGLNESSFGVFVGWLCKGERWLDYYLSRFLSPFRVLLPDVVAHRRNALPALVRGGKNASGACPECVRCSNGWRRQPTGAAPCSRNCETFLRWSSTSSSCRHQHKSRPDWNRKKWNFVCFFTVTESLLAQSVQVAQVFGPERALKCQTLLRVSLGNLQSVQCLRTCWHHHSCPQRFVPHMTCPEISQENGREFNRSK